MASQSQSSPPSIKNCLELLQSEINRHFYQWQISKLSSFLAPPTDEQLSRGASVLRVQMAAALINGTDTDLAYFNEHELFADMTMLGAAGFWNGLCRWNSQLREHEQAVISRALAELMQGWSNPNAWRMFCVLRLFKQPFEIDFIIKDIEHLSSENLTSYLEFNFLPSQFMEIDDNKLVAQRYLSIMEWCDQQLNSVVLENPEALPPLKFKLIQAISRALRGASICFTAYCCISHKPIVELHARLLQSIDTLSRRAEAQATLYRPRFPEYIPPNRGDGKLRIGYILPTIENGPDGRAVFYEIANFPDEECEVYLYSEDYHDRQNRHDVKYYRRLFNKITEVRNLSNRSLNETIDILREDQLDILAHSSARHRGFILYDRLLCHRVAPLQVSFNRMQVFSMGLDTFDYFICGELADHVRPLIKAESHEEVAEITPVSLYEWPDEVEPKNKIRRREDLKIGDDEIMYYSSAAVDKLIPEVIDVWVRILARQPNSKLVLSPFNPVFQGIIMMPVLRERVRRCCERHGVNIDRVIVLNELEPFDTHQLLDQADVYLIQWPHGGLTMLSLTLWRGCPFVLKENYYTTGCSDGSLARTAGMGNMVVPDDVDAYIDRAVELANKPQWRKELRNHMLATRKQMPHNKIGDFSPKVFALLKKLHAKKTMQKRDLQNHAAE